MQSHGTATAQNALMKADQAATNKVHSPKVEKAQRGMIMENVHGENKGSATEVASSSKGGGSQA